MIAYVNKEIVSLEKEMNGYYNITFADDHSLTAISIECIIMK